MLFSLGTGINVLLEGGELPPDVKEEVPPPEVLTKDELRPLMPLPSSRLPIAHKTDQLWTQGASPVNVNSQLAVSIPTARRVRSRYNSSTATLFSPNAATPLANGSSANGFAPPQGGIIESGLLTPPIGARRALNGEHPQTFLSPPSTSGFLAPPSAPAPSTATLPSIQQQQQSFAYAASAYGGSSHSLSLLFATSSLPPLGTTAYQKMQADLQCLVRQHILSVKIFTRDTVRIAPTVFTICGTVVQYMYSISYVALI